MIHLIETKEIAAPAELVFETINNYGRRLEWDTLLRHAEVISGCGHTLPLDTPLVSGLVVRSYSRWLSGGVVMDTLYTLCKFPDAELEMVKGPWFFESFLAKAHLEEMADGGARWRGEYTFTCRPRALRWIVEPVVAWFFLRETRMRVSGMRKWLEDEVRHSCIIGADRNT
jgi:hypothetical protein